MLAEFEDWHSDVKWMQQTFVWPPDLQTQCGVETNLSKFCVLIQPHHITSYCQKFMMQSNQGVSQLEVARQQRLLTAVSRISMHQRMQIVFMGYRERFAEVGVCTRGVSGMTSQRQHLVMVSVAAVGRLSCASDTACSVMEWQHLAVPCLQATLLSWR